MPEQEINPAAAKFISSLVKSLQILCNGQVDFDESIELVGHINVRVDRKYKFDYIVDEHVSKEGEDSSTTFLSNSYHSRPPLKQLNKKPSASELEQEIMFSEIPHNTNRRLRQSKTSNNSVETHQQEESSAGADENNQNYSVSVEPMDRHGDQPNQMVVKLEEADDSNDCMVLPASPGDYEQVEGSEAFPIAGPSASYDESISVHTRRTRKRRKVNDLGDREDSNCSYLPVGVKELMSPNETTKECIGLRLQEKSSLPVVQPSGFLVQSAEENSDGMVGATSDMSFLPGHPDYPTLEQSSKFEPGIVYDCVSCSSMFRTEKDFRVHAERCQQASISFCCSACFFRATEQESIELHLEQVHQRPVNRYKCKKCPSSFRKPIGLKKHMEVKHSETARFQCSFCGKFMYNKNDLDGHINQHKGIKPHCCSYCNKAFCYKSSMGSHEKLCSLRWPKQT